MRRTRGVRRQISSKPGTDTEHVDVDATVISVKGVRITRGDLAGCQEAREVERLSDDPSGVSRGHSRFSSTDQRPEQIVLERYLRFDGEGDAGQEGREAGSPWWK
jgi:hypothetical protein